MKAVEEKKEGVFFVYGYGGTGKTFLWQTLAAAIRSKGEIVLNVASSGIASLLLPGGRTAHSRFSLPLTLHEDSSCFIKGNSDKTSLLNKTSLIIWDEAPMMHKHAFEALDRTLKDVITTNSSDNSSLPFGGKVIVFGGDFRQVLPVVTNGTRHDIVNASLSSSYIWDTCQLRTLTKNMRLSVGCDIQDIEETRVFAEWLLSIGEGKVGGSNDGYSIIDIPEDLLITNESDPMGSLIDFVYPSILQNYNNDNYFQDRAILAPTNEVVQEINDRLLDLFPGNEKEYLSSDTLCQSDVLQKHLDPGLYSPDVLNGLKISCFPNHKLTLKVGVPVMLLRNIDQKRVMLSLKSSIEEAFIRHEVKAIVINGSRGKFSGGADVTVFGKSDMVKKRKEIGFLSIELITDLLEAARKPLVAAIDGPAFGGGLEIALACHARIATPTSQLGLTELEYGIIPGFGGTQRLPRLVGLPKALEMILMSKRVNGKDAFSMSLVDALAPADELIRTASSWALDISEGRKPWISSLYRTDRLQPIKEARVILNTARAQSQKQNPNVIHPLICIDVIETGIVSGPRSGLWKEAEALNELRQSETCKSLVHNFFARYNTFKISGITDMGLQPRKVNRVGVIGGRLVGSGIATDFILGGFQVILKEDDENSLVAALGEIKANLQSHLMAGKVTKEKLEKAVSLLKGVLDYDSFKDVHLVVEAVEGSIQLKQQIFADLEHYCPQHCILASTSPTLDLNLIAERTKSQFRIAGAHFCSPSPLLEIVNTDCTLSQVIVDLLDVAKKMKKTPILVRNGTGLVVNRMCAIYSQAATFLAKQGEGMCRMEQVMEKFGMGIGPFRMMDVESMPKGSCKTVPASILSQDKFSEKDIIEMILFPVVNEACIIMEEGSVVKASDIDVASVVAMGFPSYRGGVVYWADAVGSKYICSRLETWSNQYGQFFKPCAYLKKHSSLGTPLMQIKSQL